MRPVDAGRATLPGMRMVPDMPVLCRVCGERYVAHTEYDVVEGRSVAISGPTPCPACDAPTRPHFGFSVGAAKDLLLLLVGDPASVRTFGALDDFLKSRCDRPEAVEQAMAIVLALDCAAWEREHQAALARRPDPELQAQTAALRRIVALAPDGPDWARLLEAASRVRSALIDERARHLAIRAGRRR